MQDELRGRQRSLPLCCFETEAFDEAIREADCLVDILVSALGDLASEQIIVLRRQPDAARDVVEVLDRVIDPVEFVT
jgi:hypothetical protein